jgi:transcriptional regulator with XRE-family HTH domain
MFTLLTTVDCLSMMDLMDVADQSRAALYSAVGEKIKSTRLNRRMSQTVLANAIGLTRTSIVNIERGKQRILLHTLYELASALDIAPVELLAPVADLSVAPGLEFEVHDPDVRAFVKSVISTLKQGPSRG